MLNFFIFLYISAFKISCSAELSMKKFYNLRPWLHKMQPGTTQTSMDSQVVFSEPMLFTSVIFIV